ncbi:hypothetical protein DSO57_1035319 [Entomophthora muscae]|uniref:Uncharacterized protein n=1 Tax=Entomophthora muscae TaxID=34485 RepID=A0ACC2TM06_9FUNG|nr:hypothetical protein DSO57_1035319 [Entomophthora muscae]
MKCLAFFVAAAFALEPREFSDAELVESSNKVGFNYILPSIYYWSGGPHSFGDAHAVRGCNQTSHCYDGEGHRFCLKELDRRLYMKPVNATLATDDKSGLTKWGFHWIAAPVLGTPVKLSKIEAFNVTNFLEANIYNSTREACWDGEMPISNEISLPYIGFVGRLHLQIELGLDFYLTGFQSPSKSKILHLQLPIALNNGRCDAIHRF